MCSSFSTDERLKYSLYHGNMKMNESLNNNISYIAPNMPIFNNQTVIPHACTYVSHYTMKDCPVIMKKWTEPKPSL